MKELGVGIIGTGWVAGSHIQAFEANPHTEVRGIVSRDNARAAAKAGCARSWTLSSIVFLPIV